MQDTRECDSDRHIVEPIGFQIEVFMNTEARTKVSLFIKGWVNLDTNPKFAVMLEGKWGCEKLTSLQA